MLHSKTFLAFLALSAIIGAGFSSALGVRIMAPDTTEQHVQSAPVIDYERLAKLTAQESQRLSTIENEKHRAASSARYNSFMER